ncbi:hypothetical protein ADICYQ_3014 [Cyclobacterium qasimii M12-11B]|uniref:Uncharacterized protein n=1 Tax=Cyclobacterium qasimii M12-11B TaxID=641524 RepID=S7VEG6_9BACT|nr:hypothetical protein ADICYQ_3014 [Cyclobacterium qasimii M12-11B]
MSKVEVERAFVFILLVLSTLQRVGMKLTQFYRHKLTLVKPMMGRR